MTSWIRLWPLVLMPYLVLLGTGLLPVSTFFGRPWGGPIVREWFLNEGLLSLLSPAMGWQLVRWYEQAELWQEILLHALISLNIYVFVVLPPLLLLAMGIIRFSAWSMATDLAQKRRYFKS